MGPRPNGSVSFIREKLRWLRMASPSVRMRGRAWVERARIAAMANRILETDTFLLRGGDGALTREEAEMLRRLAGRFARIEA